MVKARMVFRRVLGLLGITLLLGSSSADALALHRCAHHDALPGAPAESHSHHEPHQAPASEDAPESGCTCIGTCATTGVALAPRFGSAAVDVAPSTFRAPMAAPVFIQPLSAAFLLPYATAPPTAL
jgi:hypothetical protein